MAPLLSFWKPAKLFSNFLVLIHSVCQILKVRIAKRGVVQRSQSLLASVFLAHYFRNIRSVQEYFLCLSIVGCVSTWVNLQISAAVPECHIYWHLQKLTVLYLPPLPSYFNENPGVFFKFITSYFPILEVLSTTFSVLFWKLTRKLALFSLQCHCLVRGRNEELVIL